MTNETTASQPKDLSAGIQHAMYQVAQRGESVERMHAAVMAVIASQPKSIGDDAQFRLLAANFKAQNGDSFKRLVAYVDSRAPAAQASAAIQAAPNKCHWCPECGSEESTPTGYDNGKYCSDCGQEWFPDIDYTDAIRQNLAVFKQRPSSATTQEPVMVAEPVGLVLAADRLQNAARNFNVSKFVIGSAEHHAAAHEYQEAQTSLIRIAIAAPMVADPAGVAVSDNSETWNEISKQVQAELQPVVDIFAATDKAVPSEALTEKEVQFVQIVILLPGIKLNDGQAFDYESENHAPLWKKPEALGLIKCTGSYKWVPTVALALAVHKASAVAISNFAAPLADKTDDATTKPGA